jgi:2,4-dienoyl-CoA reductase-like NADH-dependent reductase (Old Yellow Enzyme family)
MSSEPPETGYPHVFQPIKLGRVEVKNRIYLSPHGIALEAPTPGHEAYMVPSGSMAAYLAERARGGTGLIFHSTQLAPIGRQSNLASNPGFDESIPSYARVAERVHEHGAKIMAELWYVSHLPKLWEARGPEAPVLGASAGQHFAYPGVRHAIGRADIKRLVALHATAARNLRSAGYDGLEIHASHSAIFEHFISPYFNQRTDEYGGSLENRCRILVEALETVREATGTDLAVGVRVTADELLPGGTTEEDMREILSYLEGLDLLDFVDIDISVEPQQQNLMTTTYFEPKLHNAARIANVRTALKRLPVIGTPGRITSIAEAERLIASGAVDVVGVVRGLIAEPELVNRAREGRERGGRTCIAANHCTSSIGGTFGCAINPAAGREQKWGLESAGDKPETAMRVVVVGGGPAGMEAARVAASRGHQVILFERRNKLGGQLSLWAEIPGREHLRTFPTWQRRELESLGVDLRLGVRPTPEEILALGPEVVVVATGATYARDGRSGYDPRPVAGWDSAVVVPVEDVFEGRTKLHGHVVILDEEGLNAAAGVAEIALEAGATAEIVTRRMTPFEALAQSLQQAYVVQRLRRGGALIDTSSWIAAIGGEHVRLRDVLTGDERTVHADAVVLATARVADDALAAQLDGRVRYLYQIGDALAPRSLREATYEGHRFGRVIGEPDMPATTTEQLFDPVERVLPAEFDGVPA